MTLTSWSLGPSQCSSCLKTSRPLLTVLTLAVLARSCSSRLGLQEGPAAGVGVGELEVPRLLDESGAPNLRSTDPTLKPLDPLLAFAPLKPLRPPWKFEEEEEETGIPPDESGAPNLRSTDST